ncbi:MAG: hypothetical protein ACPL3S_02835 [Halothiobacillaceae bacterium]
MIECRGKNGWFNLAKADVTVFQDGTAAISISSQQPYRDMPPIYLSGPIEEMQALVDDLHAQLIADAACLAIGTALSTQHARRR